MISNYVRAPDELNANNMSLVGGDHHALVIGDIIDNNSSEHFFQLTG